MDKNAFDLVSKRNVERLYFPNEIQYFRFFVKRFQRRSTLINRLYYLRMRLVDTTISRFLARPLRKPKVIVNLGCGNDPLPWRSIARHSGHCSFVTFVDIDSLETMVSKCDIVKQTPELLAPLTSLEFPQDSHILLKSDQYCQIASDLNDLSEIGQALSRVLDIDGSEFLFVAEVPMVHMEVDAVDALIRWTGAIGDAEFCLLEHIFPDGPSSPFAQAILQNLAKDKIAKSVERYPTTNSQQGRFKTLGWAYAKARSWWCAWSDPLYMPPLQRRELDTVEAFDNWEEFVYLTSHYCVLHAHVATLCPDTFLQQSQATDICREQFIKSSFDATVSYTLDTRDVSPRRFGASMILQTIMGEQVLVNMFGYAKEGQLRSCDLYSKSANLDRSPRITLPQGGPAGRSHFTLTDLGDYGYLLVGGKGSSATPFHDCWVFKKDANRWIETHCLPFPLFRHTAERLGNSKLVLIAGGKLDSTTGNSDLLVYHPTYGWVRCSVKGTLQPPAVSCCILSCTGALGTNLSLFRGILAGGMASDGVVSSEAFKWLLDVSKVTESTIKFEPIASRWQTQLLARYAALSTRVGDWVFIVGGVGTTGAIPPKEEIVRFRSCGEEDETYECLNIAHGLGPESPRPFFVGASIVAVDGSQITIITGGTSCFNTEPRWPRGVYTFDIRTPSSFNGSTCERPVWRFFKTLTITNEISTICCESPVHYTDTSSISSIPRIELNSAEQFSNILQGGRPVVFERLDLGRCLTEWSLSYLAERVGPKRKVVVHESTDQSMDFLSKNFQYKTQTFKEFAHGVQDGKKWYLRALSADKPFGTPSKLDTDFPTIAKDFVLPPQLGFVEKRLFSSVLRISGQVNMWLHYDVLANIYCQVQGTKRFYLFPPSDVTRLGFAPGSSSSSIDVFLALASSSMPQCSIHEAILKPGDVLFLPQLWLHTATPISTSSVAVNVFFRDLDKGYSSGRDVYGNRDLAAYEKARQDICRMSGTFRDLPRDTKRFYLQRLADELLQIATE